MNIVISIIVGGLAGWIAGKLIKGEGYGAILNIVLGLVGASFGNFVLSMLGFSPDGGLLPRILTAVFGAVIIIWIYRKLVKK